MSGKLGARCRLTSTLETNKHDDVWLALFRLERIGVGVDQLDELVKDCLLNQPLLVDGRRQLLKVNSAFDRLAQLADEAHVDVGLEKGGADFLEHRVESLEMALLAADHLAAGWTAVFRMGCAAVAMIWRGRVQLTFSSRFGSRVTLVTAALMRRPRS